MTEADSELLSLAVHELRTPASVVSGYLRMLLMADPGGAVTFTDRQLKMIEEAEKSCARMIALMAELSELAKLERDALPLAEGTFDLFTALEDVAASVHEGEDREVHLQLTGEPSGAPVWGDSSRIRAAFDAFFRAVLREQPAACTVVVDRRTVRKHGTAAAVVAIAREDELARAAGSPDAPFDETRGGMGLALPIGRRVIERVGGHVRSPGPTDGPAIRSAIVVSLPLQEPHR